MLKVNQLRVEGCAVITREINLQVALTSMGSLWVLNRTSSPVELAAGELFGFNTGAFQEINGGHEHAEEKSLMFVQKNQAC